MRTHGSGCCPKRHPGECQSVPFEFYLAKPFEVILQLLAGIWLFPFCAVRSDQPQVAAINIQSFNIDFILRFSRKTKDILQLETRVARKVPRGITSHSVDRSPFVATKPKMVTVEHDSREVVTNFLETVRRKAAVKMQKWRENGLVAHVCKN